MPKGRKCQADLGVSAFTEVHSYKHECSCYVACLFTNYLLPEGSTGSYFTQITQVSGTQPCIDQDSYLCIKSTANLPIGTESKWVESAEKFQVFIDKEEFAAGKTKKAYKM